MDHFINAIKRYSDFKGRSSRAEYWYFILFSYIISFSLGILNVQDAIRSLYSSENLFFLSLGNIFSLFIAIPTLAVAIRRMHDVNHSGWYILFPFVDLYLLTRAGTKGTNNYGPDPKEVIEE